MKTNIQAYTQRMQNVCSYIHQHLNEDLTLEVLSGVAHFSKFHFHRQFYQFMGISVFKYIQQARLKRAAYQLVFHPETKVIEIALDAGFENPESFSRGFKKAFGQSPSQFRTSPQWKTWYDSYTIPEPQEPKPMLENLNVTIIDFPELPLAVLEHRGDVARLNHAIEKFIEWRKTYGLAPLDWSRTLGLAYDDPATTEPEKFRFDICCSVKQAIPENPQGLMNKFLPGGRCAHIRHVGSHETITPKVYALYQDWLPQSGEELRDFPCFFEYLNFFPEVAEHELMTDIFLPLK